ncbi:hypothetical protein GCM10009788_58800 [Nocardioides humi]|uniref:Homeodomain-like domain-containing protein n=1 Tax=Nocardioides humi TaxID=449461 RepID=A0ABN2BXT2_9ACTN
MLSAAQLTQGWNKSLWDQTAKIVSAGVPAAPSLDRLRPAARFKRQRRLNQDQVASLVADYQGGMTIKALTVKYNVRHETVSRWLAVNGVAVRPAPAGMPCGKLVEARALREAGWTWKRLGERYGCSHTAARKAVLNLSEDE